VKSVFKFNCHAKVFSPPAVQFSNVDWVKFKFPMMDFFHPNSGLFSLFSCV